MLLPFDTGSFRVSTFGRCRKKRAIVRPLLRRRRDRRKRESGSGEHEEILRRKELDSPSSLSFFYRSFFTHIPPSILSQAYLYLEKTCLRKIIIVAYFYVLFARNDKKIKICYQSCPFLLYSFDISVSLLLLYITSLQRYLNLDNLCAIGVS